jgi:hypothetical protein
MEKRIILQTIGKFIRLSNTLMNDIICETQQYPHYTLTKEKKKCLT